MAWPGHRALSAVLLAAVLVSVEAASAQIIDTAAGRVEFVGLRNTTPEQAMEPLLRAATNGRPHLCAESFLQAGYAGASVRMLAPGGSSTWLVMLVEDEHRDRIRPRALATESCELPEDWAALHARLAAPDAGFQIGMNLIGRLGPGVQRSDVLRDFAEQCGGELPCAAAEIESAWDLVEALGRTAPSDLAQGTAHAAPADAAHGAHAAAHADAAHLDTALWLLRHDREPGHRAAAACVLAGFPERDLVFWELTDAVLDQDDLVSDFAAKALQAVAERAARTGRTVDWAPAASALRRLLDGTSLFEFDTVVEALELTGVSPQLAAPLLGGGGDLLLAAAGSADLRTAAQARALLARLRGDDAATQRAADRVETVPGDEQGMRHAELAAWRSWVATLPAAQRNAAAEAEAR